MRIPLASSSMETSASPSEDMTKNVILVGKRLTPPVAARLSVRYRTGARQLGCLICAMCSGRARADAPRRRQDGGGWDFRGGRGKSEVLPDCKVRAESDCRAR